MKDQTGRDIHYLRISITDRCNLRCRYCMPAEGITTIAHEEILTYDEILRLVKIFAGLGVDRIRLTGGEPLVRRGVENLAAMIKKVPGIDFLGLTTNALLLDKLAVPLRRAGVDALNISIDTLDPGRYAAFTRRNEFDRMMRGLDAALAQDFKATKINAVLSPESVPEDWLGVISLAKDKPLDVRLIEWMPMSDPLAAQQNQEAAIPIDEALALITKRYGQPIPLVDNSGGGPAKYYQLPGFKGRLGIIPAMTRCFCEECNRVRLTARGELKLCLFYDQGVDLKPLLRGGASDADITAAIEATITSKPLRHSGVHRPTEADGEGEIAAPDGMYNIGG